MVYVAGLGPSQGGKPIGFYRVDPSGANLRPVILDDTIGQYPEPDWAPKPKHKKKRRRR